jgi:hypothetical protein
MPGGSFPMFASNLLQQLLYSCLLIKDNGVDVCEIADSAI